MKNSQKRVKHRAASWRVVAAATTTLLFVAAASELEDNWQRLKSMPPEQRVLLLENLRKFDLTLDPGQQTSLRELDTRLQELTPDQRDRYLLVLKRYHVWLNSLPENLQTELAAKPPNERMALVRKLIEKDHPVPSGETPPDMRIVESGELSPFELASAYRIWHALGDRTKASLERDGMSEPARRKNLFFQGTRLKPSIPRETLPEGYDPQTEIPKAEAWRRTRPPVLADDGARAKIEEARKKMELQPETARKKTEEVIRKAELGRHELLRRQAINLYVASARVDMVDSERLAHFVRDLPSWIRSTLDSLPPDVARRRLTVAYRLVFPPGQEIDTPKKTSKAQPAPTRKAAVPRKKAETAEDGSPF